MYIAQVLRMRSSPTLLSEAQLILAKNRQTAASHYEHPNKTLKLEMSADPTLQSETAALINLGSKITISRELDLSEKNDNRTLQLQNTIIDHFPKTGITVSSVSVVGPEIKTKRGVSQDLGITAKNHKRHIAQHNYCDHANAMLDIDELNSKRKARGGVTVPFPIKLHKLLDDIEKDGQESVISWQPHGRAFVVHKPKEFIEYVLPKYFQESKFRSFQKQLNRYGFSRLFSGKDKGGYYHELFLWGRPFLSEHMVRTIVKGTVIRGLSSPDTEPDFYSMSMPPVLPNTFAKNEDVANDVKKVRNQTLPYDHISSKTAMNSPSSSRKVSIMQADATAMDVVPHPN